MLCVYGCACPLHWLRHSPLSQLPQLLLPLLCIVLRGGKGSASSGCIDGAVACPDAPSVGRGVEWRWTTGGGSGGVVTEPAGEEREVTIGHNSTVRRGRGIWGSHDCPRGGGSLHVPVSPSYYDTLGVLLSSLDA